MSARGSMSFPGPKGSALFRRALQPLLPLLLLGSSAGTADVVEAVITDALGNVRVITDDQGNILERHDYLPFGEECTTGPCASNPGVGAGQPRKFTGKERDQETGLDYFGARYYGSKIGRFTTVDPSMTIRENVLDPQRWNRYAYGRNNPLRFVDPDGRDWLFRAVMGQQYVQQYGDRSSFSVFFQGISGDIPRAGPPFQDQMATDITIAALIMLVAPPPAPARGTAGNPKSIELDAGRYPQSVQHLEDAGVLGQPRQVNRAGAQANRADALRGVQKQPGLDLDEAPPAMLRRPGEPASVRPISPSDNRGCGACMGNQARDVPEGGWVTLTKKPPSQ